ncbi:DUF3592 domain-containing protein [Nakamurella flava]|uniref:DUF3592 domain-containing protein n=1 Tax=Nakamurella flava TaxID=2576308 RepID=A0A4U6QF15_9ACTN|nr:DUF3592 domain-containing protein [Nakamurella flava]TKV58596.1 DUF3592 domain-containing protein [Nakamurella flava]
MAARDPLRVDQRGSSLWRWVAVVVAVLTAAVTVMCVALFIGMRANDAAIDRNPGTATATVLYVSPLRTGIEFIDASGATIRPANGVLYPGLLTPGERFQVDYSTADPQTVRVAGRTASLGTLGIVFVLLGTYLVTVPAIWWCRRRAGRPLFVGGRSPADVGLPRSPTRP